MSVSFELERREGYLYFHCTGRVTQASILELYSCVYDIAGKENANAVLVDLMDVEGPKFTTLERHAQGMHVAEMQMALGRRVTYVVSGRVPLIDPLRHGETVAKNRGVHGKVFTDLAEATAWIEADVAQESHDR